MVELRTGGQRATRRGLQPAQSSASVRRRPSRVGSGGDCAPTAEIAPHAVLDFGLEQPRVLPLGGETAGEEANKRARGAWWL